MASFVNAPSLFTTNPLRKRFVRQSVIVSRNNVAICPLVVFITPQGFCEDKSRALSLVKSALSGGATIVQLRDSGASDTEIIHVTEWLLKEFDDPSKFSINGPVAVRLAKEYPGLGVHLRQVDTPTLLSAACELPDSIVSCSAHSVKSVKNALNYGKPNFFQVGTMFTTRTHPGKQPEGPRLLAEIRTTVPNTSPLVAVGGIDANNTSELIRLGADGIAVITAISNAPNPEKATTKLVSVVREEREKRNRRDSA